MSLDRRSFIASAGAFLATTPRAQAARDGGRSAAGSEVIPLWPGQPPGGGGPTGPISVDGKGAVSNVAFPVLQVFSPARPNGAAMLVAAGGGYKRIEMETEAYPAARWLTDHGITAFILRYRLPEEGWTVGPLAPLQDAQRALRVIRAGAARHAFDPNRIGALGFSAGGHLLGLAATRSAFQSYRGVDAADDLPARPVLAALIYPIITLMPPYDHTSTRMQLVGHHPDPSASAEWSVETHVHKQCPPVFLAQAQDDPISNIANSRLMADACRRSGIPVEAHTLASGGHGFGMGTPGTPTGEWPVWYAEWLHRNAVA